MGACDGSRAVLLMICLVGNCSKSVPTNGQWPGKCIHAGVASTDLL